MDLRGDFEKSSGNCNDIIALEKETEGLLLEIVGGGS